MHHWIHIATTILITAAIITAAIYCFRQWLGHRERSWAFVLKQDNNKALAPLKITAYERLVVMLERISPQSLIMRHNAGMSNATMLQLELIRSIREEFEHNISLQMYVSSDCWERIKKAKEDTTELIKVAYSRVRPDSTGMELSREILHLESHVGISAIKDALLAIRLEMGRYF